MKIIKFSQLAGRRGGGVCVSADSAAGKALHSFSGLEGGTRSVLGGRRLSWAELLIYQLI